VGAVAKAREFVAAGGKSGFNFGVQKERLKDGRIRQ